MIGDYMDKNKKLISFILVFFLTISPVLPAFASVGAGRDSINQEEAEAYASLGISAYIQALTDDYLAKNPGKSRYEAMLWIEVNVTIDKVSIVNDIRNNILSMPFELFDSLYDWYVKYIGSHLVGFYKKLFNNAIQYICKWFVAPNVIYKPKGGGGISSGGGSGRRYLENPQNGEDEGVYVDMNVMSYTEFCNNDILLKWNSYPHRTFSSFPTVPKFLSKHLKFEDFDGFYYFAFKFSDGLPSDYYSGKGVFGYYYSPYLFVDGSFFNTFYYFNHGKGYLSLEELTTAKHSYPYLTLKEGYYIGRVYGVDDNGMFTESGALTATDTKYDVENSLKRLYFQPVTMRNPPPNYGCSSSVVDYDLVYVYFDDINYDYDPSTIINIIDNFTYIDYREYNTYEENNYFDESVPTEKIPIENGDGQVSPIPEPEPAPKPTPTPAPTSKPTPTPDPIPSPPPIEGGGGGGIIGPILDFISGLFSWLFEQLGKLVGFLIDLLKSLLTGLFIPDDDYFNNITDNLKITLSNKLPYKQYLDVISSLDNIQAKSDYTRSNSGFENPTFVFFGVTTVFPFGEYVNPHLPFIRQMIQGLFYIYLAYYNYNQVLYLIRGSVYSKPLITLSGDLFGSDKKDDKKGKS